MAHTTDENLDFVFYPRSVALVGITTANPEHWTRNYLDALTEFQFDGPVYLVNPKGGEINGQRVYTSFMDVPGTVDYVVGLVPAQASLGLIEECAAKGVRVIHFCTAGFSETGDEERSRLEIDLADLARKHRIRIIGPNCLGAYCPESRLTFGPIFPKESGPVGLISQSGGNANYTIRQAAMRGVRFSKVVSFGNACDLNACDFLEYMAEDDETRVIALYLEGVGDGERLRRALAKAAGKKPVVLLKGGRYEAGARAVAGHTSSLAGSEAGWDALVKQLGLIRVDSLNGMIDVLVTLLFMDKPEGRNAALMGSGGGASILITDAFEAWDLKVPPLPDKAVEKIAEYTPLAGNILRNPIDYSQSMGNADNVARTVEIITECEEIDFLVWFLITGQSQAAGDMRNNTVMDGSDFPVESSAKPVVAVIEPSIVPEEATVLYDLLQRYVTSGLPVYYSFAGAASAIDKVMRHYEHQSRPGLGHSNSLTSRRSGP